jgi:hypothetical protein
VDEINEWQLSEQCRQSRAANFLEGLASGCILAEVRDRPPFTGGVDQFRKARQTVVHTDNTVDQ